MTALYHCLCLLLTLQVAWHLSDKDNRMRNNHDSGLGGAND